MLRFDHPWHLQQLLAIVLHKLDLAPIYVAATEAKQAYLGAAISAQLAHALVKLGSTSPSPQARQLARLLGDRLKVLDALTLIPSQLFEVNNRASADGSPLSEAVHPSSDICHRLALVSNFHGDNWHV